MSNDKPPVEISEITERAVYCLFQIWSQYDSPRHVSMKEDDGRYVHAIFDHQCMTAGESVADLVEDLGIGYDQGWQVVLNERGLSILNKGEENDW